MLRLCRKVEAAHFNIFQALLESTSADTEVGKAASKARAAMIAVVCADSERTGRCGLCDPSKTGESWNLVARSEMRTHAANMSSSCLYFYVGMLECMRHTLLSLRISEPPETTNLLKSGRRLVMRQ